MIAPDVEPESDWENARHMENYIALYTVHLEVKYYLITFKKKSEIIEYATSTYAN